LHSKEQLLSCVIVLDQFPRNMFRNTPAMFSSDALAQMLTLELVGLGYDKTMPVAQASFCYMPLMHSEQTPDQQRCVELFIELSQRTSGSVRETVEFQLGYAKAHRDIVARFGRFPHRNQVLGRQSTEEELAFLKEPGSSF
jgi:uncharacterized protein (DUF924 family)